MRRRFTVAGLLLSFVLVGAASLLAQQPSQSSRAVRLFKNRQYNDAVKLLLAAVKGKSDEQTAQQHLLIGECYYQTKRYGDARPYFEKVVRHLGDGTNKVIAEQRLVSVAFRLKDFEGANDRIDAFLSKYPSDRRAGSMLNYKMLILSMKGADSRPQLQQLHKRIQDNVKKYGYTTSMEADRILCDFYRKIGQAVEARELYARIVYNFRRVIAERQSGNQPIPAAFEKAHDNAALQLGVIYLDEKNTGQAIKWLENVRYDQGMKQKAKLMLAKSAYERRDFNKAMSYLTSGNFLDTVPSGRTKSDMFLLLGLAESAKENPSAGRVEQYLRNVAPTSKGYSQAQATLGGIYQRKSLLQEAVKAYTSALESPDQAADALFALGEIHIKQAGQATQAAQRDTLYRKASDMFNQLYAKYPLAPVTKRAAGHIATLQAKGIDVSFALGQDEKLQTWQKTVQNQPGTEQAVRALMSLMRTYSKAIVDKESDRVVTPPDHIACAKFADQLLDEKTYSGKGFTEESWRAIRAEANYLRGQSEIASVKSRVKSKPSQTPLRVLENASADRAIELFRAAKALVDPKSLDLLRGIELGLVEAMFKSSNAETQQAAEKRFTELEDDYGNDARFQHLALELAEWYRQEGRFAAAARQYAGIADRAQEFDEEQILHLLYTAGLLYSKAAYEAFKDPTANTYALHIHPKEVVKLGGLLQTYRPLQRTVTVKLPGGGRAASGRDALFALSKAAKIPFVWRPDRKNKAAFDRYIDGKLLDLPAGKYVVREVLEQIIDPERHRLELDLGLSSGKPTYEPKPGKLEDPDDQDRRTIEFYDVSLAHLRLESLNRDFGSYAGVYGEGFSVTLYRILKRIEELTECRILWADGIDRQEVLATEYQSFPDVKNSKQAVTCASALNSVLQPVDLEFRIVRRKVADDLYEAAFAQFNKIRQINPKHDEFGQKSLFALALNFSQQRDYPKMKIVLREYLKMFDNPNFTHYRAACFWVGWAFENEKNYRDAVQFYSRAAEERLVIYKLADDETPPSTDELNKRLSYDAQFALAERINGEFAEVSLSEFADFLQINTRVEIRLDATAQGIETKLNRDAFKAVPAWDVLTVGLRQAGCGLRVENADPKVAERAYYRMASSYRKDNLMQQALENCRTLLSRYPNTDRRPDAYRLMIDIYKGLKDYGKVLATLDDYKASGSDIEKYQLDFEIGRIHFDMADYDKAAEFFRLALAAAKVLDDRVAIRDGYAKALYRTGDLQNALPQFETLAKEETDPLRIFVAQQMAFLINFSLGNTLEREYPESHLRFIQTYERLAEADRNKLSRSQFAKATWIYYVLANIDLKKNRAGAAKVKLNAVTNSPDEFLAAAAAYELGVVFMKQKDFKSAREVFEHLLFALNSAESSVRATYALALCLEKLNKPKQAVMRYKQLVDRYPVSPYVEQVKANELYRNRVAKAEANAAQSDNENETAESKNNN